MAMQATIPQGTMITQEQLNSFLRKSGLNSSDCDAVDIIKSELGVLVGTILTKHEYPLLACGIAGSWRCVSDGFAYLHTADVDEIDVWGKVLSVSDVEIYGKPGYTLTFVLCNSSLAGRRVLGDVDRSRLSTLVSLMGLRGDRRRQINKKPMRWYGAWQVIGGAVILRVQRVGGDLQLLACGFNDQTKSWNRDLAKSRDRRFSQCPYGARHDCQLCDVGINECERSCVTQITNFLRK
jgi:hypothetical protein